MGRATLILLALAELVGCSADRPLNPSFPLTMATARQELDAMRQEPKPLPRPVVVLAGIYDPGSGANDLADQLRAIAPPHSQIISIHFVGAKNIDACAQRVIDTIEESFPSDAPEHTIEIDVVASSMGGVVARHAANSIAQDPSLRKRLNIARLFTISTPHRGAKLAHPKAIDKRIADLCRDSDVITAINGEPCAYELIAYTRLDDGVVGEENAAPPGQTPYWVANLPFHSAHLEANDDPRIIADIARRLRGEQPYTKGQPTELPPRKGAWRTTLLAEK